MFKRIQNKTSRNLNIVKIDNVNLENLGLYLDKDVEITYTQEKEVEEKIKEIMMVIPNIIDPSVPIGKDDSQNVEIEKFGDPFVPDFEIPYHTEESLKCKYLNEDKHHCNSKAE